MLIYNNDRIYVFNNIAYPYENIIYFYNDIMNTPTVSLLLHTSFLNVILILVLS